MTLISNDSWFCAIDNHCIYVIRQNSEPTSDVQHFLVFKSNQIKSFIFESRLDNLQSIDKNIIINKKRVTEGQGDTAMSPIAQ